jgi:hypothetical protein
LNTILAQQPVIKGKFQAFAGVNQNFWPIIGPERASWWSIEHLDEPYMEETVRWPRKMVATMHE